MFRVERTQSRRYCRNHALIRVCELNLRVWKATSQKLMADSSFLREGLGTWVIVFGPIMCEPFTSWETTLSIDYLLKCFTADTRNLTRRTEKISVGEEQWPWCSCICESSRCCWNAARLTQHATIRKLDMFLCNIKHQEAFEAHLEFS